MSQTKGRSKTSQRSAIRAFLKNLRPRVLRVWRLLCRNLWELRRIVLGPKLPSIPDGKTLIHLGCGVLNDSRYINVDARRLPHVHYVAKADTLPFFPDNFADLIYACYCGYFMYAI